MSEAANRPDQEPVPSENFEKAKAALMKLKVSDGYSLPNNVEGLTLDVMYDTGREPDTGTSRDDIVIGTLDDGAGNKQHFKLDYYFRSNDVTNVEFLSEDEANKIILEQKEYYKPYWEEKK